jgi:phage terminase large subunit-like protein
MEAAARKAMATPSAVGGFLTKRLNVWVNADHAWMDMQAWDAAPTPR